jgi:hypothetical protein
MAALRRSRLQREGLLHIDAAGINDNSQLLRADYAATKYCEGLVYSAEFADAAIDCTKPSCMARSADATEAAQGLSAQECLRMRPSAARDIFSRQELHDHLSVAQGPAMQPFLRARPSAAQVLFARQARFIRATIGCAGVVCETKYAATGSAITSSMARILGTFPICLGLVGAIKFADAVNRCAHLACAARLAGMPLSCSPPSSKALHDKLGLPSRLSVSHGPLARQSLAWRCDTFIGCTWTDCTAKFASAALGCAATSCMVLSVIGCAWTDCTVKFAGAALGCAASTCVAVPSVRKSAAHGLFARRSLHARLSSARHLLVWQCPSTRKSAVHGLIARRSMRAWFSAARHLLVWQCSSVLKSAAHGLIALQSLRARLSTARLLLMLQPVFVFTEIGYAWTDYTAKSAQTTTDYVAISYAAGSPGTFSCCARSACTARYICSSSGGAGLLARRGMRVRPSTARDLLPRQVPPMQLTAARVYRYDKGLQSCIRCAWAADAAIAQSGVRQGSGEITGGADHVGATRCVDAASGYARPSCDATFSRRY